MFRSDPFPEFGVAVGERKTATAQTVVRSRHVRPDSGGGIYLQIAVIQGAHVLFTPDKGHARVEGTGEFSGLDVCLEAGIVTQGQSLTIEIAHLAVHGVAPQALPIVGRNRVRGTPINRSE